MTIFMWKSHQNGLCIMISSAKIVCSGNVRVFFCFEIIQSSFSINLCRFCIEFLYCLEIWIGDASQYIIYNLLYDVATTGLYHLFPYQSYVVQWFFFCLFVYLSGDAVASCLSHIYRHLILFIYQSIVVLCMF